MLNDNNAYLDGKRQQVRHNKLTFFTVFAFISGSTFTSVGVNSISTASVVLTRHWLTVINVYNVEMEIIINGDEFIMIKIQSTLPITESPSCQHNYDH